MTAVSVYGPYTLQNAATATGTGTPFVIGGFGVANLAVSGNFTATITVQVQDTSGNWTSIDIITQPGNYKYDVTGLNAIRANITSYTSGSVTVVGTAQALASVIQLKPAPYKQIDYIGSYNPQTFTYTPSTTTIAANTVYWGNASILAGYQNVQAYARSNSASASTNWKLTVHFGVDNASSEQFMFGTSLDGTAVTTAGAQSGASARGAVQFTTGIPAIINSDTTNALKIDYFTMYVQ